MGCRDNGISPLCLTTRSLRPAHRPFTQGRLLVLCCCSAQLEAWMFQRRGLGSHFVSCGTIKCIAAQGETSETRWRSPWLYTLNPSSLVYPTLSKAIPPIIIKSQNPVILVDQKAKRSAARKRFVKSNKRQLRAGAGHEKFVSISSYENVVTESTKNTTGNITNSKLMKN